MLELALFPDDRKIELFSHILTDQVTTSKTRAVTEFDLIPPAAL